MNIEPPVALSLSRPWPWAFLLETNPKLIENRRRKDGKMPPMCSYRGELFLHAAISWDPSAGPWMQERGLLSRGEPAVDIMFSDMRLPGRKKARDEHHPPSVIFARCKVVGHIERSTTPLRPKIFMGPHSEKTGVLTLERLSGPPHSCSISMGGRNVLRHPDEREIALCTSDEFWWESEEALYATELDLRWWMGGYALVLADVKPTPHVVCKGNRGLWKLPPDVFEQLSAS